MSIGAAPPFSPKPQYALELGTIVQLFNSSAKDHPIAAKLAANIKAAHGHIPDEKFIGYLRKAVYLTRRQVPLYDVRATMCREYVKKYPDSTIPFLLADFHNPKLDVAKFRELLPLLNAIIVHSFRSYEKAKQTSSEGAEILVSHLTKGHQNDPCQVCQSIMSVSAKLQKKREHYELMQKYVAYMLNWAERKLMTARETEVDPWMFATGMLIGAVIGGYLGQMYLIPASLDSTVGAAASGGALGGVTLNKLKRMMTEALLLDRPKSYEAEPEWIVLTDQVRYRFEEISSGYLRRMCGLSSFTLGEVEITFGRLDSVICLFNLAEDWRIHGNCLFELRRHFLHQLDKNKLKPMDCISILTTLKTSCIGRGLLHFKTKGFFGPSYSCFFTDIMERCQNEIKADPASQLTVVSFEET